jgi:uncharacterized heparinase superfamily protein
MTAQLHPRRAANRMAAKVRAAWLAARRAGLRRVRHRIERRLRLGLIDPRLARRLYAPPALSGISIPTLGERQREALLFLAAIHGGPHPTPEWDRAGQALSLINQPAFDLRPPVDWNARPVADPLWNFKLHSWEWTWPAMSDPDSRLAVFELWRDWLARMPVGRGLAWEPHPTSQRLVVWSVAWHLLGGDVSLAASIAQGAAFLADHLERDLDNNHLVANAKALAWVSLLFPTLPQARRWRTIGLELFWQTLDAQVLADGGHNERSSGYHLAVWLDALELALLCRATDVAVPAKAWDALRRMQAFALAIRRPDGRPPLLSDSVEDQPLPAQAIFALANTIWQDQKRSLESAGSQELRQASGSCALDASGYVVLRSGHDRDSTYLVFDAGDLGLKHFPGHGHADALSFELWSRSEALVVDPGTYQYPASRWRDYFRGTAAHSTAVVDGLDQSVFVGPFRVAEAARGRIVACALDGPCLEVVGEHDGYTRLPDPVVHRRTIQMPDADTLMVSDVFAGNATHHIVVRFHLARCQVSFSSPISAWAYYPGGTQVEFSLADPAAVWQLEPGWMSRGWYQKEVTPMLVCAVEGKLPLTLITQIRIMS